MEGSTSCIHIGKKFYSQKDFNDAKEKYEKAQKVPYVLHNCKRAELYNSKAAKEKQIPAGFMWKESVIACKHYGEARQHKHVEGRQKRANQSTFKRGCCAKFNLNFLIDEKCYVVTKLEEGHTNHTLDNLEELADLYPEFRRPKEEVVQEANKLFDYEVKTHRIRAQVMASGVKATAQDIQNLRNKWRDKFKGKEESSTEAMLAQLRNLKEEDPNSIIVVNYDESTYEIQSVFFQTSEMRAALEMYPEVLIMDTTYSLCENNMPLVVYQAVDCFGAGRIVGYAFIISEKKDVVTAALGLLKVGFENLADKVEVVVIDKDPSEIAAIKEVLPNSEIHLCDYHVLEVFKKNTVRKLTDKDWDEVDPLIKKLIYAFSKKDYDKAYNDLQNLVGENSKFMEYFNNNWHSSDLVWSEYRRNMSFTVGERTTGRNECHNAKIKEIVTKKMPVAMVILRLRLLHKGATVQKDHKLFQSLVKTKYHKYSSDPVLQSILKVNTPFVGDLLKRQYERSLDPPSTSVHKISCETCDCAFFIKLKLPCSHIFRERRLKDVEIYNHEMVPRRWTVLLETGNANGNLSSNLEIIANPVKAPKRKKTMAAEDRFNLVDPVLKRLSPLIVDCGGDQFEGRLNALLTMESLLKMGKEVAVIGMNDQHKVHQINELLEKSTVDENIAAEEEAVQQEIHQSSEPLQKSICDEASEELTLTESNGDEPPSDAILITAKPADGKVTFTGLDSGLSALLKLPVKPPVRGRPKGKRQTKLTLKKNNSTHSNKMNDDVDDDVDCVADPKCSICKGPVSEYTSYTRKNYRRKYIKCSAPLSDECRKFHAWVETDIIETGGVEDSMSPTPQSDMSTSLPVQNIVTTDTPRTPCLPSVSVENVIDCDLLTTEKVPSSCIICRSSGPPSDDSAHKCYLCRVPVHAFGCSVQRIGGSEGFGGFDRMCLKCFQEGVVVTEVLVDGLSSSVEDSPTPHSDMSSALPVEKSGMSSTRHSDVSTFLPVEKSGMSPSRHSDVSTFLPVEKSGMSPSRHSDVSTFLPVEKKCFGCNMPASLRTSRKPVSYGRRFYTCPSFPSVTTARCRWMNWVDKKTQINKRQHSDVNQPTMNDFLIANSSSTGTPAKTLDNADLAMEDVLSDAQLMRTMADFEVSYLRNTEEAKDPSARNESAQLSIDNREDTSTSRNVFPIATSNGITVRKKKTISLFLDPPVFTNLLGNTTSVESGKRKPETQGGSGKRFKAVVRELTDDDICNALDLLRDQFPDIDGLQKPAEGLHTYNVMKSDQDTVHILFDRVREHWVTVVSPQHLKSGVSTVFVYDSMQRPAGIEMSDALSVQIASMCNEKGPNIHIVNLPCQQQEDKKSCGYFAIANAVGYCISRKVKCFNFKVSEMATHLKKCFDRRAMTPFPKDTNVFKSPTKVSRKENLAVYCTCRLPEGHDRHTIECERCFEWFHFKCVNLSSSPGSWICNNCRG